MKYEKRPTTIKEQIKTLSERGLLIEDYKKAESYLSNISYYRLRAYTYPFQDNNDSNHPFIKEVSFNRIIDLYIFDRRLRILIFNAIEKIEIALRTKIVYHFSLSHGSHFYENEKLYRDLRKFDEDISNLESEIDRSTEDFIKHYKGKYDNPVNPPAWMSLEIVSMSLLSRIYSNLARSKEKVAVAKEFGLPTIEIAENWFRVISNLRNACAHHSRIWNRRFIVGVILPKNPSNSFLENIKIRNNKIYAYLAIIQYFLRIISPDSEFSVNLRELINTCPLGQIKEMGFPEDWIKEELWN